MATVAQAVVGIISGHDLSILTHRENIVRGTYRTKSMHAKFCGNFKFRKKKMFHYKSKFTLELRVFANPLNKIVEIMVTKISFNTTNCFELYLLQVLFLTIQGDRQ